MSCLADREKIGKSDINTAKWTTFHQNYEKQFNKILGEKNEI
jgi:hypothetical protein